MGCNQSTERKGASAAAKPVDPAAAKPQEETVVVQEVVAAAAAPEPTPAEPIVQVEQQSAEATVAAPVEVIAAPAADPIAQETAPVVEEVAAVEIFAASAPVAAELVEPVQAVRSPVTAVPALALPARRNSVAKRAKTPTRSKTPTPRGHCQKENAAAGKNNKTPNKAPRGLSVATPNKAATVVLEAKKVSFDPVPVQESKAEKTKKNARKVAGKHACNVNEELFLASIAAFERQLTHRGTLDAHLNSR